MSKRSHRCKRCGRYDHVCGRISARGLCADCAEAALQANLRAMAARQGPGYERQQRRSQEGMFEYLERRLIAKLNAPPDQ